MLVVNPEERITVQEALEHPWTKDKPIGPYDSTDSLTGAFNTMNFVRRKVDRERTLLSHATKNSRKRPGVVIHQQQESKDSPRANGAGANGAGATTTAFMKVGGKGVDETLYADAKQGRSDNAEFPLF